MFVIDYQRGFLLYLILLLGSAVGLAAYYAWRTGTEQWDISEARTRRCPACNLSFVVGRHASRATCPRCGQRVHRRNR